MPVIDAFVGNYVCMCTSVVSVGYTKFMYISDR